MGVVKLLKMIGSLKVMIILKKNLNILLVLLKTERQARPPNELCFAGKYGWNDGKSGKDGKVLLSKPFSEIKSRPGHNETDSESTTRRRKLSEMLSPRMLNVSLVQERRS